jgi:hypothetical protein
MRKCRQKQIPKPLAPSGIKALPAWQREREAILQRLCIWIESKVSQGKKVRPLARQAARRWHGKAFRCDPSRKLTLSANRLVAIYYKWQRSGRNPRALALEYAPANRRPVTSKEQGRFLKQASAPGIFTFAAAWKSMERTAPAPFTLNHLCQSLPKSVRRELRRLFHARRNQRGIETRFGRYLAKGGFRI